MILCGKSYFALLFVFLVLSRGGRKPKFIAGVCNLIMRNYAATNDVDNDDENAWVFVSRELHLPANCDLLAGRSTHGFLFDKRLLLLLLYIIVLMCNNAASGWKWGGDAMGWAFESLRRLTLRFDRASIFHKLTSLFLSVMILCYLKQKPVFIGKLLAHCVRPGRQIASRVASQSSVYSFPHIGRN